MGPTFQGVAEKGIWQMISLKLIALIVGAGMVIAFVSEDFGTNLVLAILTCLT